jgi:hypothetical protein
LQKGVFGLYTRFGVLQSLKITTDLLNAFLPCRSVGLHRLLSDAVRIQGLVLGRFPNVRRRALGDRSVAIDASVWLRFLLDAVEPVVVRRRNSERFELQGLFAEATVALKICRRLEVEVTEADVAAACDMSDSVCGTEVVPVLHGQGFGGFAEGTAGLVYHRIGNICKTLLSFCKISGYQNCKVTLKLGNARVLCRQRLRHFSTLGHLCRCDQLF